MSRDSVEAFVTKYMEMLSIDGERPNVKVVNNLGAKWFGLCEWKDKKPNTTTIYVQEAIVDDAKSLERVIAHEMIHHREMLNLTVEEKALLRFGVKPIEHGAEFRRGAAEINAVMGANFVTEKSDKEYAVKKNTKPYYVLIMEGPSPDRLMYAWAAKLSKQMVSKIERTIARGGKLVKTTDEQWTNGPKISRFGGGGVPTPGSEREKELRRLYDEEPGLAATG